MIKSNPVTSWRRDWQKGISFNTLRHEVTAKQLFVFKRFFNFLSINYPYLLLILIYLLLEEDVSLRSFLYHLADLSIIAYLINNLKYK